MDIKTKLPIYIFTLVTKYYEAAVFTVIAVVTIVNLSSMVKFTA